QSRWNPQNGAVVEHTGRNTGKHERSRPRVVYLSSIVRHCHLLGELTPGTLEEVSANNPVPDYVGSSRIDHPLSSPGTKAGASLEGRHHPRSSTRDSRDHR